MNYNKSHKDYPKIEIDQNKIREALLVVIENAVRYNKVNGKIDISSNIDGDFYYVIIENTGVGITHDEQNKLFSKLFYRSERAKLTHPIGMGLGLSVARSIVRAHHGDISISSEGKDMGAKVIVSIPLKNHFIP